MVSSWKLEKKRVKRRGKTIRTIRSDHDPILSEESDRARDTPAQQRRRKFLLLTIFYYFPRTHKIKILISLALGFSHRRLDKRGSD